MSLLSRIMKPNAESNPLERQMQAYLADKTLKAMNVAYGRLDKTDTYGIATDEAGNVVSRENASPNQLLIEYAYTDILTYNRKKYPLLFPTK